MFDSIASLYVERSEATKVTVFCSKKLEHPEHSRQSFVTGRKGQWFKNLLDWNQNGLNEVSSKTVKFNS
ncbi:unnamed protein product [Allacma fusca]|uniref:Uncharacterized protein n=1 Tax=Allacma fusca TaxID=39272 RepID=A0A8J2KMU6_9HEXA|nr:unnamed protein product [Allacma fusca]